MGAHDARASHGRRGVVAFLCIAALVACGCSTGGLVPPRALTRLDGFGAVPPGSRKPDHAPRYVETTRGGRLTFDHRSEIRFRSSAGLTPWLKVRAVELRDGAVNITTWDARPTPVVTYPLSAISAVEVSRPRPGLTALALVGAAALALLIVFVRAMDDFDTTF